MECIDPKAHRGSANVPVSIPSCYVCNYSGPIEGDILGNNTCSKECARVAFTVGETNSVLWDVTREIVGGLAR